MIIDTHVHFYDPQRPQGVPWPPAQDAFLYRRVLPEHFRALAAPAGVTHAVAVEASPWLEDNQWLLDLAAQQTGIVGVMGHLVPGTPEFAGQLGRFARDPRFRGIRIGGARLATGLDGLVLRDLGDLAGRDLTLDVLMTPEQLPALARLAGALPRLRIVINHVANVRIDGQAPPSEWVDGMRRLAAWPRVYCKASGLVSGTRAQPAPADVTFYTPVLEVLWDAFGEDRLLFGTDWPVSERFADYATVVAIGRTYAESKGHKRAHKFLATNAIAAYKLTVGEGPHGKGAGTPS